jgi:hypothetical protein
MIIRCHVRKNEVRLVVGRTLGTEYLDCCVCVIVGMCPYLDTIDRSVLDFDFEKLCSVSLSRINVYACLICGKYFQVSFKNFKEL